MNSFLDSLGLGRVEWLTQQRLALLSLIIVDTWQWTPFIMLIALAGLTAVPKYLYEAAEIDRASEWFKFRRITLPLVWPLLLIAVMFRAIEAFRLFDLVYILTGGGPGGTTETLSYNVYKVAFFGFDTGPRRGLRDPHGDRRHRSPRSSICATSTELQDALTMATHIQTDGSWPTRASPARPPPRPSAVAGAFGSGIEIVLLDAVRRGHALPGPLDARDRAEGDPGHLRRPGQGVQLQRRRSTTSRTSSASGSPVLSGFKNSVIVVRGVDDRSRRCSGVPAAWAYSRFPIPAKKDQLFFILSTRFMPPVVVVIPIFLMFRDLGLLDTLQGLILVYAAFNLPFTIWMMKGFIDEVPGRVRGGRDARRLLALRGLLARHAAAARSRASPPPPCSR